ncbi:MAG: hypothetical protein K8J31_25000, partial [Anaerolineae bacterium]|nr:hypothetical protein [Anaerolineae bacterium]
ARSDKSRLKMRYLLFIIPLFVIAAFWLMARRDFRRSGDPNKLTFVQRNGVPVTIVLLNNNGGGIFHRLPIKNFEPEFTDLFVMPHGLEFEHAAKLYGLEYVRADDRESFRQAFSESVTNRRSRIIEVRTEVQHDLQRRQEIMDAVQARIAELNL